MDSIKLVDGFDVARRWGPAKQINKGEREIDSLESGERLLFMQFS